MKKFWKKSLSKFQRKSPQFKSNESIFIPFAVVNDTNKRFPRILQTKNFNLTKKIKHPSGTAIIHMDKSKNLFEKKLNNKKVNHGKLILYKNPTKKIYLKKTKEKSDWRY